MSLDPRTPVIVGVAQVTDRVSDPTVARTPVELMVDALRSAARTLARGEGRLVRTCDGAEAAAPENGGREPQRRREKK